MDQSRNQNRNNNSYNRTTGGNDQNKTFEEMALDIQNDFFSKSFPDILNMSKCKEFDRLLADIERFVKEKAVSVSPSQLRNIYDKAIKVQNINELKMIRPKLAYIAGKEHRNMRPFFAFIDSLIKKVDDDNKMAEFKSFFESVVAYHKLYAKAKV